MRLPQMLQPLQISGTALDWLLLLLRLRLLAVWIWCRRPVLEALAKAAVAIWRHQL